MLKRLDEYGKGTIFNPKEYKDREENVVFYDCKKLRYFILECIEQHNNKKKSFILENLDSSNSNVENDEAHIRLMADIAYNISNGDFNEEVYFNDIQFITQSYYEVISNTSIVTIVFKNIKSNFQSL